MNLTEIKKNLDQLFSKQPAPGAERNIIFWYDDTAAFAEDIDSLGLENAKLIKANNNNMFATKMYIERTDPKSNLLVYLPLPRPDNLENWLTDTIKYSSLFSADELSLILLNFGMDNSLKATVSLYKQFFLRYKTGIKKFESYNISDYTENSIHKGVLSALCKLPAPNFENVVRDLVIEFVAGETTKWDSILKYANEEVFWKLTKEYFGFDHEEKTLDRLAITLLCSHLAQSTTKELPKEWSVFISDNSNCLNLINHFMNNSSLWEAYNQVAAFVSDKLGLASVLNKWSIDEIATCDTFEGFDKAIINRISGNVLSKSEEYTYYREVINSRRNRRYYKAFEVEYNLLSYACEYLELEIAYKDLLGVSIEALFNQYTTSYYKLDSLYRKLNYTADQLENREDYKAILETIESSYTNWFLRELNGKWNSLWEDEKHWHNPAITSQQDFFETYASKFVKDDKRIVVIISDALRYETAVELNERLNRELNGASSVHTMLGVVPSYTKLGMASLLPRKQGEQIEIRDNATYEISGISTDGTENRSKILGLVKQESLAIQLEDIRKMSGKEELKEKLGGVKLIYVYHNVIDAIGDKANTEEKVFDATETAMQELVWLVKKLSNDISAINITITADHGYIYRRNKLDEHDKTPKVTETTLESKRRYVLSSEKIEMLGVQNFSMDYLTKAHKGTIASLPRGINCFKTQGGGNRYVHGGASLQEVTIPVITFKSGKNDKGIQRAKKVGFVLSSISRKITSTITNFNFTQTEAVDGKNLPVRVLAYFENESGERISNENIIIADSTSTDSLDRQYKEKFTLKSMPYNKADKYYLVLVDEEETVQKEISRTEFMIDISFGGGIQF